MHVFVIEGCRANGATKILSDSFVKGLKEAGHEVEQVNLFTLKQTHGCINCCTCKRNGGTCVWKDDIAPLLPNVQKADVLVFASPVYYFGISSQLNQFLDRTYAIIETIRDKKIYFITTAEGPYSTYAKEYAMCEVPVKAWACCHENVTLEKTIGFYDTGTMDVSQSDVFSKAYQMGKTILR